jgi:phosphatidate phosphatase APP1
VVARPLVLLILPLVSLSVLSSISQNTYSTLENIPNTFQRIQTISQPEFSILVSNNPIARGYTQTIVLNVFDLQSGQGIPGVTVDGTVTYAPGLPVNIRSFTGKTDNAGYFYYSWTIEHETQPGIFTVAVSATSEQYFFRIVRSTMFEVM